MDLWTGRVPVDDGSARPAEHLASSGMPDRRHPPPDTGPVPVVPGHTLEERLGRGGSGEVWRARPRGGGDPVAVKVLLRGDPERQVREAALLAELDHPHLVRLHRVVRRQVRGGPDQVSLVLDLLAGGSLATLLAHRGRLRPGEVVTAVAPVAAALAHAHERGIVHGDLSPGNIVFTAEGRPVLTDLGVARVLGQVAEAGREVTPPYVDPVVARGGAAGPASDVFGVAAAAYHALTGVPPWNAASPADTLAVAARGEVPDLALLAPEAPAELVRVVSRGLSPEPHLRGSAAAFALDLRHACRPERVVLPRHGSAGEPVGDTGRAPRTELTHQVPGRRPAGHAAAPAPRRGLRRLLPDPERYGDGGRWPGLAGDLARKGAALAVLGVALAVAVWLGVHWGREEGPAPVTAAQTATSPTTSPPPPPPAAAPATAGADPTDPAGWAGVLDGLYASRAAAFTAGDPDLLDEVYSPVSPLRARDAEELTSLASTGERVEGFAPTVVSVESAVPDTGSPGPTVRLTLVDRVPPYAVVAGRGGGSDGDGGGSGGEDDGAVTAVPERGPATVTMVVAWTPAGWRIVSAEQATG